jgi:GntR family transcriptional regulator/MocR family aminotransferase
MSQPLHRKAPTPKITVERGNPKPLYRQIYERVRHGIAHGSYQPGVRLPSARNLASELGVARGTVEDAYGLLTAEGYIERHGQGGSVIARTLATSRASTSLLEPRAQLPGRLMSASRQADRPRSPFQLGQPAF